jgi:hypothetical protein
MRKFIEIAALISWLIASCNPTLELETAPADLAVPSATTRTIRSLPVNATWQIQYTDKIDLTLDVNIYNLDLFDIDSATISQLHDRSIFVMCYFSAGSLEDWRVDAGRFPLEVLGKNMEGWPGERWLDIRQIELLKPIMESRLDLATQKGCDGVDPDNVNGYTNDTGFPLVYEDQKHFNVFLAEAAHQRGLKIGLKNDLEQIPDLLPYFDWELNEECFELNECQALLPFVQAGKPVFVIEYETKAEEFCPKANKLNFNALQKNRELDAFRISCK